MTAERLKEITERVTNATPGPWTLTKPEYKDGWPQGIVIGGVVGKTTIYGPLGGSTPYGDAKFMAAARQDVPELLAHIQALEEANARFVKLVPTGKFPVAESLEVRAVLSDAKKLLASAALSPAPATTETKC